MEKTSLFQSWLALTQNNWEAVFFIALSKGFGLKLNGMTFAQMALSIPWNTILKNSNNVENLEALLMGQAGLFNTHSENAYFQKQQKAHAYLKHKYQLNSSAQNVKFLDYYQAISPLFVWRNWLGLCIKNHDFTPLFMKQKP